MSQRPVSLFQIAEVLVRGIKKMTAAEKASIRKALDKEFPRGDRKKRITVLLIMLAASFAIFLDYSRLSWSESSENLANFGHYLNYTVLASVFLERFTPHSKFLRTIKT